MVIDRMAVRRVPDVIEGVIPSGIMTLAVTDDVAAAEAIWAHGRWCVAQRRFFLDRQAVRRGVDHSCIFVDQWIHLLRVKDQIAYFTQTILVFHLQFRVRQHRRSKGFFSRARHYSGPGGVDIPRDHGPKTVRRVVVVVIVFALVDIIMMDSLDHRPVAVITLQIQVLTPPGGVA